MSEISISNSAGRDAAVAAQSVRSVTSIRWIDEKGRQATAVRIVKATIERDAPALARKFDGLAKVGAALVEGDPEIDMEHVGRYLRETSRVYVNSNGELVHKVQFFDVVRNPDGTVRERRPRKILDTNLAGEAPLRWSGKFIKKEEAIRKFVFSGKVQLHHINGLTYDFLFGMAKQLEEKQSLMLLGAGPKSNQPLILKRGGTPYRGFLEGRTDRNKYCLILHFSNMELKVPEGPAATAEAGAES
jgi:hypothetical protein